MRPLVQSHSERPGGESAARAFSPAEPGTAESRWLGDPRWDDVPAVPPGALEAGRVMVLSAHPDDETLGVGALIADLAAAGVPIEVVVATDGAASHPNSELWSPERLATLRDLELRHALGLLAPGARLHTLGLTDGALADDPELLATRLRAALPDAPTPHASTGHASTGQASTGQAPPPHEVILAPYAADGHPDHDTLGRVAAEIAVDRGARLWYYPIWLWHWSRPDEFPWARTLAVSPSPRALHAKAAAIDAHRSQVEPLSLLPGDEALLPAHVLTRFRRVTETLIAGVAPDGSAHDGSAPDGSALDASDLAGAAAAQDAVRRARRRDGFGAMLADSDDPWDSTSWYERRKHALTLAVRSRERYGEVVEIGCSTGALTALLAGHADHVTALDGSAAALGVARSRGLSNVSWTHGEVPGDLSCLADHSTDLVVLSEIAYFLTGAEFLGLLRQARRLIRPGGEIVLVDWLAGSAELPLDGGLAHEQAATAYGDLDHRLSYRDDSIRLDAWGGVPIEPGGRP